VSVGIGVAVGVTVGVGVGQNTVIDLTFIYECVILSLTAIYQVPEGTLPITDEPEKSVNVPVIAFGAEL
jgi:uncharacterized membrane protein YdfJ with MMPL/SSD domain